MTQPELLLTPEMMALNILAKHVRENRLKSRRNRSAGQKRRKG